MCDVILSWKGAGEGEGGEREKGKNKWEGGG